MLMIILDKHYPVCLNKAWTAYVCHYITLAFTQTTICGTKSLLLKPFMHFISLALAYKKIATIVVEGTFHGSGDCSEMFH